MTALPVRALCFAVLWWALAEGGASGGTNGWLFGVVAVCAATAASTLLLPPSTQRMRWVQLPVFVAYFLANSLRGGWQVASMALRGRRALQPAFVDLPLELPQGAAQILFTNALCMMPGTVGVQLEATSLRVHVLDTRMPIAAIAKALERRVAALFGARA